MTGHALLIGSETDGLTGVGNDLDLMEDALRPWAFAVRRVTGPQATRDGILAAYRELIDTVQPGDPAVIYYSGHGGRVEAPPPGTEGPSLMDLQFIAPTDFHDSSPGDFRGITSVELSVLLKRLTDRTENATVILDCCHAAHMSRDRVLRTKAVPRRAPYDVLRAHIEKLLAEGALPAGPLDPLGNRHAVRIVACEPEQSAFEYLGVDGETIGVLTESLAIALREAGSARVSWATVLGRVRRRVLDLSPFQRPEVEGPALRFLFDVAEDDAGPLTPLAALDDGRAGVPCGALLDAQVGDIFKIDGVGALRIDRMNGFTAEGSVAFDPGVTALPPGAKARRVKSRASMPVLVPDRLHDAIDAAPGLRAARPDEPWYAAIRTGTQDELTIHDRIGPLPGRYAADAAGIAEVRRGLEALARVRGLRALAAGSAQTLGAKISVEWGTVHEGVRTPLPASGATVHAGDRVYLSIRNDSEDTVYLSLVDLGITGGVAVLTYDSPSGRALDPGREHVFGFDGRSVLPGIRVGWPDGLDPAQPRPETVLLLVTEQRQDISMLTQRGVDGADPRDFDLPTIDGRAARYDMHTIDFELDPATADGFLIDELPSRSALAKASRDATTHTIAVRLDELLVHRNHAWRGADIRVDTFVATGVGGERDGFEARTERFPGIRSGDALPVDRMLLYHGPARDFLDLAIWVSRDTSGKPTLAELLSSEAADFELRETLARLTPNLEAMPGVAGAVTAVGIGALLVSLGYRLLRRDGAEVIGLYRGSRLAHERFGAGRHPAEGARRVQDFSLAFTVEEVPGPSVSA
ncbi:MAG TPA: caspase family protein [Actinospica sp.]|nr:caspase family protein [Actinospica sp.]